MSEYLPLSVPSFQGNEWKYVKECLDTEWVSSAGKYVDLFEKEICKFTKAKYATACVNGTAALQIALIIAGVRTGDEVIVPTVTFLAPVNVIRYLHAEPVFMDCDDYYNIDISKVSDFILNETVYRNGFSLNRKTGKRIAAIIPVHVIGNAVNLEPILSICRKRNIAIIEDSTESLGTCYNLGALKNQHTGTIGAIGCFSFNGNKIITSGGGGMIVTNNAEYAERAKYLTTQAKDDPVRYIHNEVGYNFRMTNIQAALGLAQFEQLSEYLKIKRRNYQFYKNQINTIPGLYLADTPEFTNSNFWFYSLQIQKEHYGMNREQLMTYLGRNNIQSRPIWQLNHLQKPYKKCQTFNIEKAFHLHNITLNIPCSVNLSRTQIQIVIDTLRTGCNR